MKTVGWMLFGASVLGVVVIALARRLGVAGVLGSGTQSYLCALIVGAVGLTLLRFSLRPARPAGEFDASRDDDIVEEQLERLVQCLAQINTNSESMDALEVRRIIDTQLSVDMNGCVAAREALSRQWGLQPYGDFLSRFVAGQRNISLARSASDQGQLEEMWDNLGLAEERMAQAYQLLKRFRRPTDHPSRN